MEALGILLALLVPIGLLAGWGLGIAGWRQARRARAEIEALRAALQAAGIAVPDPALSYSALPEFAPRPPPPWRPPSEAPPAEAAPAPNPWAMPEPLEAAPDPAATAPPDPPTPPRPGLEALLTQRWGVWLGAVALLLAGVFLVRYAVEEGWLGPAARCALAGLLGAAMILGAEWLRRRPMADRPGLPWPDQAPAALAAGGVATLFGAAYATASMYALVPPLAGFVLLGLAALAGIALALLQGPLVAAIGIAGAYATPALVETQDPSLPGLFLYLLAVTAAALAVLRQVGAAWLGWVALLAAALWALAGGAFAAEPADLWAPVLFLPAVAALHLALLPGAALEGVVGRRLGWIPFAGLAGVGLALVPGTTSLAPAVGVLLLGPIAIAKGIREPRMDRLPWLAALAGLLMLLLWDVPFWQPAEEAVTIAGAVQAILPASPWPPEALGPFLAAALALAGLNAAAGLWRERRGPHPLRWAALPAAVPVLVLLVAYARVRGFALDASWALVALGLAAGLVVAAAAARRGGEATDALRRAGAHAAGAVAALALGAAMILADQWLTLAIALMVPPLAWIEGRTGLRALRWTALAAAAIVLVRLLLNDSVLDYAFGPWPVLNGLLAAYGATALSFALGAALFARRGDDLPVRVLEGGAVALATALLLLEVRHLATGGVLGVYPDGDQLWSFREAALQASGVALLAALLRLLNRRLGERPVLGWGWRAQQGLAMAIGVLLLVANPALDAWAEVGAAPVLNALLAAYAIPAALAAAAAMARESAVPRGFRWALAGYAFAAAFAWVSLEVRHHFHPDAMVLAMAPPAGAELYAYSFAWLGLGAVLLALGIRTARPGLRRAALAVIAATILKAFLVDMAELEGLWRVLSFLGLGLALIALGRVYRRFVGVAAPTPPPAPAPPG